MFWFAFPSIKMDETMCQFQNDDEAIAEYHFIQKLQRETGAFISKQQPQPEFQRNDPFYYIQGSYWSVTQATIRLLLQR
jgi:hypothetical protein